jgi:NAD-reducing hydrogenase small subunit
MSRIRLATTWLDGCSGCHMSLLDTDERLLALLEKAELVFSPLIDIKEFPENVDVALVEGSISSDEDVEKIHLIRRRTRILVAFGDCAVTGNVPAMRNPHGAEAVLRRAYLENVQWRPQIPSEGLPALLPRVRPISEEAQVDFHLPGCPPPADLIFFVLSELCEGRVPDLAGRVRFG